MKAYLPIAIAVALVVAALVAGLVTSARFQSPQARLFNAIDQQIEEAQELLYAYEPDGERFLTAAATTQPVELLPEDRWSEQLDYAAFQERMDRQGRDLRTLTQQSQQLGAEPGPRPGGAAPNFERLEQDLQQNQESIERALGIVRAAIAVTEQAGDTVIRGSSHPTATRLEAILITAQADLLRRRAAVHEAQADAWRIRVSSITSAWKHIEAELQALAPDRPGAAAGVAGPATRPSAPARPQARRGGLLGQVARLLFARKPAGREAGRAPSPPATAPVRNLARPAPNEPTTRPDDAEPAPPAPGLAQRLADLDRQHRQTLEQIEQAKADAAKIQTELAGLEQQLSQVQAVADEAQQRMLALEQSESDPADPAAPQRFETEYRAASEIYREASRKKAELIGSAIPKAGPQPGGNEPPATPPGGVIAGIRSRLEAARRRVQDLDNVRTTVEAQIEQLRQRQQDVGRRYASLRDAQVQLESRTAEAARAAIAAARAAGQLETQALELLENDGRRAAQNARSAEENRLREAQSAKREITGQTSNPRLDLITQEQFIVGHAQTLEADVEFLRAQVLAQHVRDLEGHRDTLAQIESMGIADRKHLQPAPPATPGAQPEPAVPSEQTEPTTPGEQLEPTPAGEQFVPDYLLSSQAAAGKIDELRAAAVQAAESSLELYAAAEGQLNRLWVIRATRAAVNYLLANLHTGEDADRYRQEAVRMYQQAVQDRGDLPEAQPYRRILEGLTQAAP